MLCLVTLFAIFFLVSCNHIKSCNITSEVTQANFTYLHKNTKPGTFKMSYKNFEGNENIGFNVRRGNRINFKYKSTNRSGTLSIIITDPYGNTLETLPINRKGSITIKANDAGRITIVVTGKNTSGSFKVLWKKEMI